MKQTKVSWNDRLIKWFFGIPGVVDEHIRAAVGRTAVWGLVSIFLFDLLSSFALSLYAVKAEQVNFEHLFYVALITQMVGLFVVVVAVVLLPLERTDIFWQEVSPAQQKQAVRKLRRRYAYLLPIIFIAEWLLNTAMDYDHGSFWRLMFSWRELHPALRFVIILGIVMYAYERWRIRTVKDDD
ncbi:DUF3278 domain-containing protein [Lacticaseibacillus thailandensis]|uniref:DUF3278 domain-containing protein n=1 Tax=Lacticaseibacillus thailandensis DSM 22698 = JCM 13996 TaxID=1423810 RepID=A0A0R2C6U7_9LACO|nr:DUF3278 domain-containing protein [Lacticaseibacillus thailandensis]KRM87438.1 hypothetical protein FD19_GL000942 [Lacticaseibacillus thailandensis DSM 22698 = JCM 13996]